MRTFLFVCLLAVLSTRGAFSQGEYSAASHRADFAIGAGVDYWATDYSHSFKLGPALWGTAEFWHGLGVIAEGHSLLTSGDLPDYRYAVGEGGLIYTTHRWDRFTPFIKGEAGFGGLTVPRHANLATHYTRTTYAVGAGVEHRLRGPLYARADYTYEWFPDFVSPLTFKAHSLNPNGVTVGMSFHIQR